MTIKLDNYQSIDLVIKGSCEIDGVTYRKKSHNKTFAQAYAGSSSRDLIVENPAGFFVLTPQEVLVH